MVSESGGFIEVKLIPKHESDEKLNARFDRKDFHLTALISDTPESRTLTEFSATQLNIPLEAKLFEYKREPSHIVHEN